MKQREEYIKVDLSKGVIKMGVQSLQFDDNGFIVIYLPSLNLSAYGTNIKEAKEMLGIVLDDFCENLYNLPLNQITTELKKFGWNQNKYFKKQFEGAYIDREGILKNFELSENTIITEKFVTL